jgi:hypothetical protein
MLAGAGTVDGRAAGALIKALRLAESFDISTDERLLEGCRAIKNANWGSNLGSEVLERNSGLRSGRRAIPGVSSYKTVTGQ